MSEKEIPQIAVGKAKGDQSSGGLGKLPEGSVEWLLVAMEQHGADIDIPAHEEDAERELTKAEIEAFDLSEGTNFSIESLFGYDIERPYVGNPKMDDGNYLDDPEHEGGEDSVVDRHVTVNLGHSINGHFGDRVAEVFGDDVHIRVGMGASGLYEDNKDRARHVRFKTTSSGDKSRRRRYRSKRECEGTDYSREDYERDCLDIGLDPYSHNQDATETLVMKSVREDYPQDLFDSFEE